jgi:hypothetical protein
MFGFFNSCRSGKTESPEGIWIGTSGKKGRFIACSKKDSILYYKPKPFIVVHVEYRVGNDLFSIINAYCSKECRDKHTAVIPGRRSLRKNRELTGYKIIREEWDRPSEGPEAVLCDCCHNLMVGKKRKLNEINQKTETIK